MSVKLYTGPILESDEPCIAIGMNAQGSLGTTFLRDFISQYPTTHSFFRRWAAKKPLKPGDFQGVPGLSSEGAMIRPTIYSLVVATGPEALPEEDDIVQALTGAWEECLIFGFTEMALHAPSICSLHAEPARQLSRAIEKIATNRSPFKIYES